jgi:hypothetical protein
VRSGERPDDIPRGLDVHANGRLRAARCTAAAAVRGPRHCLLHRGPLRGSSDERAPARRHESPAPTWRDWA